MFFSQQELLLFLILKLVLDYSCLCFPMISLQPVGHGPSAQGGDVFYVASETTTKNPHPNIILILQRL